MPRSSKLLIVSLLVSLLPCPGPAQDLPAPRGLLSRDLQRGRAAQLLVPREQWKPFPEAKDRTRWEALPLGVREALVKEGERRLAYGWPPLLAVRWLDFVRDGDRSRFEKLRDERRSALRYLALAEAVEGRGRFLDDLANGIWSLCEESWWGNNAHTDMQAAGPGLPDLTEPIVELQVGEAAALLAWTYYLHAEALDRLSPRLGERIALEVERRLLVPARHRDFGWKGYGTYRVTNWNPWIGFNWLCCSLLLEKDPRRRAADFTAILRVLDNYLDRVPEDGGCEEGPNYWGHAAGNMFAAMEMAQSATTGALDPFSHPVVAAMGRFPLSLHVADDWYFNFSDAWARMSVQGGLLKRWGARVGDPELRRFGLTRASPTQESREVNAGSLYRLLSGLWLDGAEPAETRVLLPSHPQLVWLPETGVWIAREQAREGGGWFAGLKVGHNGEAHNHNDVGHLSLYVDGKAVVVDAGRESYRAGTFGEDRYQKIWYTMSDWHNVPFIEGFPQGVGAGFAARDCRSDSSEQGHRFSAELASAYPAAARLETWRRTVLLRRTGGVRVEETFRFFQAPAEVGVAFLCRGSVKKGAPGLLLLCTPDGPGVQLQYAPAELEVAIEPCPSTDSRFLATWGARLERVRLFSKKAPFGAKWCFDFRRAPSTGN